MCLSKPIPRFPAIPTLPPLYLVYIYQLAISLWSLLTSMRPNTLSFIPSPHHPPLPFPLRHSNRYSLHKRRNTSQSRKRFDQLQPNYPNDFAYNERLSETPSPAYRYSTRILPHSDPQGDTHKNDAMLSIKSTQAISFGLENATYCTTSCANKSKVSHGPISNAVASDPISSLLSNSLSSRTHLGSFATFRFLQASMTKFVASLRRSLKQEFTNLRIRPTDRDGLWYSRKAERPFDLFTVWNRSTKSRFDTPVLFRYP